MTVDRTLLSIALPALLVLGIAAPVEAAKRAAVGTPAPWFSLKTMTGKRVTRDTLRGKVAVLVVGLTYPSAPPCKKWVMALTKRTKATVYQVIVADKPWYIPKAAVRSKIRGFTPSAFRHRVLVEWYRVFADQYRIPAVDQAHLLVLDKKGVVRLRLRANPTPKRLADVERVIKRLSATR